MIQTLPGQRSANNKYGGSFHDRRLMLIKENEKTEILIKPIEALINMINTKKTVAQETVQTHVDNYFNARSNINLRLQTLKYLDAQLRRALGRLTELRLCKPVNINQPAWKREIHLPPISTQAIAQQLNRLEIQPNPQTLNKDIHHSSWDPASVINNLSQSLNSNTQAIEKLSLIFKDRNHYDTNQSQAAAQLIVQRQKRDRMIEDLFLTYQCFVVDRDLQACKFRDINSIINDCHQSEVAYQKSLQSLGVQTKTSNITTYAEVLGPEIRRAQAELYAASLVRKAA